MNEPRPDLPVPNAPAGSPGREVAAAAAVRRRGQRWLWIVAGTAAVLTVLLFGDARALLRGALAAVEQLGPWGPVLFVAVYVAATVLLVPGSVLTLGAGVVFGVAWGSVYVSLGSTLGATCAFLLGRHLARERVARRVALSPTFAAIDRAVAAEGWKIVGLARLSPVFPFVLLNYAFGLTSVSLRGYVLASWIGMMPGTVMYVYLGSLARAGAGAHERTSAQWALYAAGLVATIAVTVVLTRIARRALLRKVSLVPSSRSHAE